KSEFAASAHARRPRSGHPGRLAFRRHVRRQPIPAEGMGRSIPLRVEPAGPRKVHPWESNRQVHTVERRRKRKDRMFPAGILRRSLAWLADKRLTQEEGQALVEYAIIISFIAVVTVIAVRTVGSQVVGMFSQVASGF